MDERSARYLGYNLDKVNDISKQCQICDSANHFTVECRTYRDMDINKRYSIANSHHLCINCMISTEHAARNCDLKLSCGYKVNKNLRCSAKHHVTLHKSNDFSRRQQYRMNSNYNDEEQNGKVDEFNVSQQSNSVPSTPTIEEQREQNVPADGNVASGQVHVISGYVVDQPHSSQQKLREGTNS